MPDPVLPADAVEEIQALLLAGRQRVDKTLASITERLEGVPPGPPPELSPDQRKAIRDARDFSNALLAAVVTTVSGVYDLAGSNRLGAELHQEVVDLLSITRQIALWFLPKTGDRLSIPDVFKDGAASAPTNHATYALFQAIHNGAVGRGWGDNDGETVPMHITRTNRGRGMAVVSMRPESGTSSSPGTLLPSLWEKVRALDDLCSDTLLVCLAQWANRAEGPTTPVWITADAILDARGVQRIQKNNEPGNWQHGHRREDRLAAGRALAQLDGLWIQLINVEVTPSGKQRKPKRLQIESSRALAILDRNEQIDLEGNLVFIRARVMPGEWASAYWELELRQVGLFAQRALAYDPYRQQVEKRIAKYLAFQFKWNAGKRRDACHLHVSTLLKNAGAEPEQRNPQRTRKRLEQALATLKTDGVIADWSYVYDPDDLPARGWLAEWLGRTISIEPPPTVQSQYARLGSGQR